MDASISEPDKEGLALAADALPRSSGAIISEGVLAGFVAAAAVAVVFLVIDVAAGQAFRTPRQLGAMLLSLFGVSPDASGDLATTLALYTLFHFVAFIIAGIIAAAIVQVTMKQPVAILLFVILFFAFEVAFTGFVAFLDVTSTSGVTPVQVAIGNVVASVAMAVFFRARHPKLRNIGRALAAEEE
jgi:glycopeptide antibiotics resistance protein